MDEVEKVIIIGSGPAGLTAALYAARGGLTPLVIEGQTPGGQPTLTSDVEDFPGFPEGIKGPEMVKKFKAQAQKFGTRFLPGEVMSVDFKKHPFEIKIGDKTLSAKVVIVASGSSPQWLGLPSEQKLIGKGVSVCAVCDGPFFKDKKVVVVGGGDSAFREAYHLSKLVKTVTIIHRRNQFRAQKSLQDLVQKATNIKFVLNSVVEEVLGEAKVTGVRIKNIQTGKISTLPIDGIFIAIGQKPKTDFLKGHLELDQKGYVILKGETQTSVPGVFAAGDVADPRYRQSVTAAGSGCKAALDAEEYLDNLKS
jgi:thioredoxin reductase (NADPH)